MNNECRKVRALLSLYTDNALSNNLKMFVNNHLQECKPCFEHYINLKKTMDKVHSNFQHLANKVCEKKLFDVIEYENFKQNTSAFLDEELTGNAAIQFKNCLETMPEAKKHFNNSLMLQSKLKNFFETDSPILKHDFSKEIVSKIKKENKIINIDFSQTVLTLILGFFIITCLWTAEKIIFNKSLIISFEKASKFYPKIKPENERFKIFQPAQKY